MADFLPSRHGATDSARSAADFSPCRLPPPCCRHCYFTMPAAVTAADIAAALRVNDAARFVSRYAL